MQDPQIPEFPAIWRATETRWEPDGVARISEALYDETPGFVSCTVRSYDRFGFDYESRRFEKTDADGGWRLVA